MKHINGLIERIEIGAATASGRLTMTPLLCRQPSMAAYLTLDDALAAGAAEVAEMNEQGQVPEILFRNRGDKPVLLLDGEELIGAKQNRILNLTILAPSGADTRIPVSCVEAGRWGYQSRNFGSSDRTHHARGRAAKLRQVSESMFASGSRRSDQAAVWDELANVSAEFNVRSETAAMADVFEHRRENIDVHVIALQPVPGQVGAIFSVDSKVVGLDLFDDPATCTSLLPKLIRSYALGAIGAKAEAGEPAMRDVPAFLQALRATEAARFQAVGLGEDWRMQSPHIQAAALVHNGAAVHLCAFAV